MTVRANDEMMPSFTVISNEFIDTYMASANGEYVKVYLYVLRAGGHVSCEEIADALEMTATDAARAVSYWSRRGLLSICGETGQDTELSHAETAYEHASAAGTLHIHESHAQGDAVQKNPARPTYIQPVPVCFDTAPGAGDDAAVGRACTAADGDFDDADMQAGLSRAQSGRQETGSCSATDQSVMTGSGTVTGQGIGTTQSTGTGQNTATGQNRETWQIAEAQQNPDARQGEDAQQGAPDRQPISADDIARLRDDEEFAGLLYCLQQYMGRTFGQKDVESLVYIYDTLHLSTDMIEYLAEICVKRGRTSSRYMEAIARDWVQKHITTVEEAKAESSQYSSQVWTVMRAFGINDRKPAEVEQTYVDKWFHAYAFSEDIVKEAISRTIEAIHKPSFQYADSILEKWHNAGIRRLDEIKSLDTEHEKRARTQATESAKPRVRTTSFSNFKQRDDDLNAAVLARLKDIL